MRNNTVLYKFFLKLRNIPIHLPFSHIANQYKENFRSNIIWPKQGKYSVTQVWKIHEILPTASRPTRKTARCLECLQAITQIYASHLFPSSNHWTSIQSFPRQENIPIYVRPPWASTYLRLQIAVN